MRTSVTQAGRQVAWSYWAEDFMFYLQAGNIIPNAQIGFLKIGAGKSDITSISKDFSIKHLPAHDLYVGGDIQIWLHRATNCVTQIMVYDSFGGKFANRFGIGSYLCDIEKYLGEKASEKLDTYLFTSVKGICFELRDIDDDWDDKEWYKANAPIEYISIFKVH
jgi:hypothetical protein